MKLMQPRGGNWLAVEHASEEPLKLFAVRMFILLVHEMISPSCAEE
jgi:hypothetical protein